jgi:hypothetical protein
LAKMVSTKQIMAAAGPCGRGGAGAEPRLKGRARGLPSCARERRPEKRIRRLPSPPSRGPHAKKPQPKPLRAFIPSHKNAEGAAWK